MLDRTRALHTHPVILLTFSVFVTAGAWLSSGINCVTALQLPAQTFNAKEYRAKGDSRVSTQGSMDSGSATLTCPDCSFTNADVGKKVYVYGASSAPYALSLGTAIQRVLNPVTATLADPATQSTSGALVQLVGTDDTKAILAARDAACSAATASNPAVLLFPTGSVYTLEGEVIETCSNLRITGEGTILQTRLLEGGAAGQGASVIGFPGSPTGRWCSGASMAPRSNLLRYGSQGDRPCNFTPADVGSSVVVQYAGENYLPLYATIARYVRSTEVVLDQPAQTAIPVTNLGFDKVGGFLQIGTTPIANVEIDHLTLTNVTTDYPPGRTLGVGIVAFGADPSSFKQNIRVHDLTVITASGNCLGGVNGLLDEYSFERNTLIGCADAAMYVAGWNSRGIVSNNTIENVNFPGLPPQAIGRVLHMGILIKNASNVTFANNRIHIYTAEGGIMFGDHPQFRDQVQNNTITLTSRGNVVGIGGNTADHILITGNQIECQVPGRGIWFYSGAVSNIEATGNVIRNCTNGIKFDGTGSGVGPASLKVKDNQITGCRDGIRLESVGGVNVVENNKLSGCSGLPWLVVGSQSGSVTYFSDDNETDRTSASARNFDKSVRQLPRGVKPPQ